MRIEVDETNAKQRADVLVANAATEYSRAALAKLFTMGNVLLDGEVAKPGDKPKIGQVLQVDLSPLEVEPDVIELPVLFENADAIVVDKPAGVISHARGRYWQEASVASFIRAKTKDLSGERAGIVHRLDRATSGVMIAARNQATQTYLQKEFADKRVQKEYIALVHGTPELAEAHIVAPLARNPHVPQQFRVDIGGKHAETTYRVIETNGDVSLIALHPLTGRTHQLRLHMLHIGHPIVGDILYAPDKNNEERMYLHAHKLSIRLPGGARHEFVAPLPKNFRKRLARG